MDSSQIETVVLGAIRTANLAREANQQLDATPQAVLFGRGSRLDSLGLVALLIDVEEALLGKGHEITLNDDRAMSQSRSPFRNVPALVGYISQLLAEKA